MFKLLLFEMEIPALTILQSQIILAFLDIAQRDAFTTVGEKFKSPHISVIPDAWIILVATFASSVVKRLRSDSFRTISKDLW
jgi:hypothetical protein